MEDVLRQPSGQELAFLRMFSESNARGIPEHVVVKKDSQVEILAGKVFVTLEESKSGISLDVGPDVWFKVRIDGKEGFAVLAIAIVVTGVLMERLLRSLCRGT